MTAALLTVMAVALADPGAARQAAVVDGRSVPLLGGAGARAAVSRSIEPTGWQTVSLAASGCSTDDCFRQAAAAAGAARLFFVDVTPVAGAKFRYDVSLRVWDLEGGVERRDSRVCEPCLLRRDFEQTIGTLAVTLAGAVDGEVARARAAAAEAVVVRPPVAPPAPVVAVPAAAPEEPRRRSVVGPVLLGAGALAAGTGGLLLYLDGRKTDCDPACARTYETHGGLGFLIGGAVAMAAGAWLWAPWAKAPAGVALRVGPGSAAVAGTF